MTQLYQLVYLQGRMDYIPMANVMGEDPVLLLSTEVERISTVVVLPGISQSSPLVVLCFIMPC